MIFFLSMIKQILGQYVQPSTSAVFKSLSANSVRTGTIYFHDGTSLTTAITGTGVGGGGGLPYPTGATAGVDLQTYSLTAASVSTLTLQFGDGTTQTTAGAAAPGVPYVGATANVNLGAYSLSARTLSSAGITASRNGTGFENAPLVVEQEQAYASPYTQYIQQWKVAGDTKFYMRADGRIFFSDGGGFGRSSPDDSIVFSTSRISYYSDLHRFYNGNSSAVRAEISANGLIVTGGVSAASISSESITSTGPVTALTVSAGNIRTAKLWFDDGTSQTTAGGGGGGGVPYTGATANVNLGVYSLTASTLSSQGITGTTVSASTLLAGNFQSSTAGLAAGTGANASQISSLWNAKVPYTGATANVDLTSYSLTSASVSTLSISSGSITATTLSSQGLTSNGRVDVRAQTSYGQVRIQSLTQGAEASIGFRDGIDTFAKSAIIGKNIVASTSALSFWNNGTYGFHMLPDGKILIGKAFNTIALSGTTDISISGDTSISGNLNVYVGSISATRITGPTDFKALEVQWPTASEDVTMFYVDSGITAKKIAAILTGRNAAGILVPAVTANFYYGATRGIAGTAIATNVVIATTSVVTAITTFTNSTIDSNNFVWMTTNGSTGTVSALNVTFVYTR